MHLTRRLSTLLGANWEHLGPAHIRGLVDQQVSEDFDLDYKASLYGGSDSERASLASDVSKFANHQGGLLLIGVQEDGDAKACGLPGVLLSDTEEVRMRSVVASNVFPHPQFYIRRIPEGEPHGTYLLYVPRSTLAPHAVRRNGSLRYPVRDGAGTRHLTESEVADAYRSRFAGQDQQVSRLEQVHDEGCNAIPGAMVADPVSMKIGQQTWLVASLVPNSSGTVPMGTMSLQRIRAYLAEQQQSAMPYTHLAQSSMSQPEPGYRRFIWSDMSLSRKSYATSRHLELHTDGSGFAASAVSYTNDISDDVIVSDEMLISELITMLQVLGSYAVEMAGISGDAAVSAGVVIRAPWSTRLGNERDPLSRVARHRNIQIPLATHTLALDDLTACAAPLLVAARLFCVDILSAFGVAETIQITPQGRLVMAGFNSTRQQALRGWVEQHGVPVVQ